MSAYLDRSQGVTFVFSNIHELYRRAREAKLDAPFVAELGTSSSRVIKAKDVQQAALFQPRELKPAEGERPFPVPMGVREAEERAKKIAARPLAALQQNLNQLGDAHEKLRFLLKELEALTKKK